MKNFLNRVYIVIICISILFSPIIVVFPFYFLVEFFKCSEKSSSFDESKYTLTGSCLVKYGDEWIPLENIRIDLGE